MTIEGQPDVVSDKRVETELYADQTPPVAPSADGNVTVVVEDVAVNAEAQHVEAQPVEAQPVAVAAAPVDATPPPVPVDQPAPATAVGADGIAHGTSADVHVVEPVVEQVVVPAPEVPPAA